uniref:Condensin-2 complex subunit H2 n=1 Tax=Amphiprion percula TaxID=161767 RepID=A0A3P8UAK5_AMPPE
MEATQSRYVHLLQPIRELTKNWDIDLASELNDYLDELDEMCITFDGGKTRLNFAEAALLIQGSASIYSKKVELLHNLVFQTLEFISVHLVSVSDLIFCRQTEQTGGSMVEVIPLPPQSLIPPETREKQKLPLIRLKLNYELKVNLCPVFWSQAPSEGRMIRERRQIEADKRKKMDEVQPEVRKLMCCFNVCVSGKCYKVPDGLDDGGKRKRKAASALQDFNDPSEHKLKNGPKFTDLNYIYLNTMEQRLKTQRRINRRAVRETRWWQHHHDFNTSCSPWCVQEQLVANSQAYTQETALSRRVKDWEEKIRPHLQLQRPTFDIHDYGDRVVESLGAISHRRFFSSIVHGLDPTEVCRFLLASLQLANDLTVQIDSAAGLEDSLDTMSLILLSTQRATDRFKTDRLQLKISDPAAPSFRPVDL